jgi:hypothetical protein
MAVIQNQVIRIKEPNAPMIYLPERTGSARISPAISWEVKPRKPELKLKKAAV